LKKVLIATSNEGKRKEIESLLQGLSLQILSLNTLQGIPDPLEDGKTFAENARKKALYYFEKTGLPTIADDSGLEVDSLGGEPGVHSARYAPTDQQRIDKLLRNMSRLDPVPVAEERSARFVCSICAVFSQQEILAVEGRVEGLITTEPRGHHGFGYDPVFYYPPLRETFAELSSEVKNEVSHRGQALRKLRLELEKEYKL